MRCYQETPLIVQRLGPRRHLTVLQTVMERGMLWQNSGAMAERDRCAVTSANSDVSSMSSRQRACAYLAILAFGVPTVVVALVGGEVWPFLDYRMYAESKPTPEVDWLDLVGRTESGGAFPLHDERYIVPFVSCRRPQGKAHRHLQIQ